ncbi:MAG: FAD-dependent oxidoreductase [Candidatus Aminicenantes bacterium]|nr:FAD-dependent oxidoreductase [Candidatus Aminicenantes bacterium]
MSNRKNKFNVVIVGSGFAGIVAANILSESNLDIVLIDENIYIGGQLLRKIPDKLSEYPVYHPDYVKKIGFKFIECLKTKKVTIINRGVVIGIYPEKKILVEVDEKEVITVNFDVILFATGARERFFPFKGWTLPGVYSTGLAQVLMKTSGVLLAEKILIGGSGLFLFAVAYETLRNRAGVTAILEQTAMLDKMKLISQLFHQFPKFVEGAKFLSKIFLSGVPVKFRRKIVEARGKESLQEVVTARVNKSGSIIPGTEKIHKTGALAVGYGFTANIELPQLAECKLDYSDAKGGWVVRVNDEMLTTREDIFAGGEITGIGGALKSINEGKTAALAILRRFDKIAEDDYFLRLKSLSRERKHHLKFGEYFNLLYKIPESTILDIPDETIVCRCEDVTMADIKKAVQADFNTPVSLKTAVRTGMGNCQGRICGPIIYDILSALTQKSPQEVGRFSVRPPVKPVSIASLLGYHDNR